MSILERVARAIVAKQMENHDVRGTSLDDADAAITAFLEAAGEQGWQLVPREATEEMGEAWAKLAVERIKRAVKGDKQSVLGMVGASLENYRAMLAAAPEFELDK